MAGCAVRTSSTAFRNSSTCQGAVSYFPMHAALSDVRQPHDLHRNYHDTACVLGSSVGWNSRVSPVLRPLAPSLLPVPDWQTWWPKTQAPQRRGETWASVSNFHSTVQCSCKSKSTNAIKSVNDHVVTFHTHGSWPHTDSVSKHFGVYTHNLNTI